jgi:uncharacterized repeat protein (TIGR01451 family)
MGTNSLSPGELHLLLDQRLTAAHATRAASTPRRRSGRRLRPSFVVLLTFSVLLVFGFSAMTVLGVHDAGLFQLDGNTTDDGLGDDWADLYPGGGGAATASIFVTDPSGSDVDTILTGGSTKDDLNLSGWKWKFSGPGAPQDKSDIVNAFAAFYQDGGDTYLYFGADRWDTNGDSQIGFWFFQNAVSAPGPGTGSGSSFAGSHSVGDILILSDFTQGGNISTIKVYRWVGTGGSDGTLDLVDTGLDCSTTGSGDDVCATVNDPGGEMPPWPYEDKDGNTAYQTGAFYEGGVNLSALLADDIGCFSTFLAETRASQSVDAQLDDFALGQFSLCDISVTKTGDTLSKVGDDVSYTITVENTGGLPLYKQSIVDTVLGDLTDGTNSYIDSSTCDASLAPAATCTIDLTYTVQPGDPDPLANTVEVTYNSDSGLTGDEVTESDDHSLNLFQPSITFDKSGDVTQSKAGDDVNYTITLTNTSSADTPDLECTITDATLGIDQDVTLASGDPAYVLTPSHTFQVGDPDPFENTASVSCSPDGFPNVLDAEDSWSVDLFQPSITFDKTGDTLSKVGDDVHYTITLTNTSTSDTPDLECTITDAILGIDQDVTLAAGDPAYVLTPTYTVQSGDPDPLDNTASVTCSPVGFTNVLNASDDHSVNLFQPSISFDKTGDELSKIGDDVDYTITLDNTSSADTPDLECTITDTMLGIDKDVTLASSESDVSTPTYTVLASDPDPLDNTAEVSCSPIGFPNVLSTSDDHSVNLFQPSITFDKTADTTVSKVGDPVNYTITLNNTSSADTPDLECTITDPLLGIDKDVTLASGATDITNQQYIVQGTDPDPLDNTASVTCSPVGFPNILTASDGHSVDLFGPSILFDKTGDEFSKVGDDVHYTITLTNTSSADTPDLECTITDTMLGIDQDVTLASGDPAYVLTPTYTVQAGDPDPLENTADVSCSPVGFPNVLTASDSHSVDLFQPSITLDKTGDATSKVGDDVHYTITLTNTSSADSPDLECTITDAMLGISQDVTLGSGDPAYVLTPTYTVQAGDPDPLDNTASASCSPIGFPNIIEASDTHSVDLFQPAIEVTKDGPDYTKVGDANVYTVTIENTGSADSPDLVIESITDSLQGDLTDAGNYDTSDCGTTLAAGDSCEITYTYVTQAGDDPGTAGALLTNTVSVESHPDGFPNNIDDSDSHSATVVHPDYTLTKDCLTQTVPVGGTAIFEVVFENTGDIGLVVTADEDLTNGGGTIAAGTPFDLAVGATLTFEVSLDAGSGPIIENTVNASATLPAFTGLSNVLERQATDACDVQGGATRTPGFWQTHLDYTTHVFEDHLGGTIDLGWKQVTTIEDLMGMFWANTAKESDNTKRDSVCQAQVIGSFQLLAAILNTGLDNGAPVPIDAVTGDDLITAMQNALAAGDRAEILRLSGLLDAYNNSGDDIAIVDDDGTPIGSADPRRAKGIANIAFADCE